MNKNDIKLYFYSQKAPRLSHLLCPEQHAKHRDTYSVPDSLLVEQFGSCAFAVARARILKRALISSSRIRPIASLNGNIPAEIPRSNLGQVAVPVQHSHVGSNIAELATESTKPAVPLNDGRVLKVLNRLVVEILGRDKLLVIVSNLGHPDWLSREPILTSAKFFSISPNFNLNPILPVQKLTLTPNSQCSPSNAQISQMNAKPRNHTRSPSRCSSRCSCSRTGPSIHRGDH